MISGKGRPGPGGEGLGLGEDPAPSSIMFTQRFWPTDLGENHTARLLLALITHQTKAVRACLYFRAVPLLPQMKSISASQHSKDTGEWRENGAVETLKNSLIRNFLFV